MATLLLGAAGASLGGSLGGSVLGVGAAAIGRAAGAAVGRAIDQRLLGSDAAPVDHGRVDRFRISGATEGAALPRLYGRMRMAGHVIWASPFGQTVTRSGGGGGKGGGRPAVHTHRYSVTLALALCEGPIRRVGRVWADGREMPDGVLSLRVHHGREDQLPDAAIEAQEGAASAPAFRGTAYVVVEDLDLGAFGNRVPQFSFEVVRGVSAPGLPPAPQDVVRGVSIIPGTGEYALATRRVDRRSGAVGGRVANVHTASEVPDFVASLRQLREEVPGLRTAALVVSWFADDLRAGSCRIRPQVDQVAADGVQMPWSVSGLTRATAALLPRLDGRAIHGGTPTDASVIEAIRALKAGGQAVTYHPFLLTTQLAGNGLPDPYGGAEQASLPWRGRITASVAIGRDGTPDGTAAAEAEVAAFFGGASARDFVVGDGTAVYRGAADWGFRRFVLHQAALCAAAGGVEAFCLGSELPGLTRIRGADGGFPAVAALRSLAGEVRALLPMARLSYAADWTEYGGYAPADGSGDLAFPLDPLWSDDEIDFVGVNFYAPVSDWRPGPDHLDAAWGDGRSVPYLQANLEGGEAYDWFYASDADRAAQRRTPIADGAHGEPWVYRAKDMRGWWANAHHERRGGVRSPVPTGWRPGAKPIRLIEFGCAAVDNGAAAPNRFPDPRSSEGGLPPASSGAADEAMQMHYLQAVVSYWSDPARNPDGAMIDMERSCVWAWDARPWPAFPDDVDAWGDAPHHAAGHWWTGRSGLVPLACVIADVCSRAGVAAYDVSGVVGAVRGLAVREVQDGRADLQPILLAYGVDVAERDGVLRFRSRGDGAAVPVTAGSLVRRAGDPVIEEIRDAPLRAVDRVVIEHARATGGFDTRAVEAVGSGERTGETSDVALPLSLTDAEADALAERMLTDGEVGRTTASFALPPSRRDVGPGDVVTLSDRPGRWLVGRATDGFDRRVQARRIEPSAFRPVRPAATRPRASAFVAAGSIDAVAMDLPLRGAGRAGLQVAASAQPWSGPLVVVDAGDAGGSGVAAVLDRPSAMGVLRTALGPARPAVLQHGPGTVVEVGGGVPSSIDRDGLLSGGNLAAVGGSGSAGWELVQFQDAAPLGGGAWRLTTLLRGLRGTEAAGASGWPAGAHFVLLDGSAAEVEGAEADMDRERRFRVGPSDLFVGHDRFVDVIGRPRGAALAPFPVAHLSRGDGPGGPTFAWIRRTRAGGDSWDRPVPLGEAFERYAVRIVVDGATVWEDTVPVPRCTVPPGAVAPVADRSDARFEVAQLSDVHGPGGWVGMALGR